ncbi:MULTISPECIES: MFS transporter [Chitinophagaceae]
MTYSNTFRVFASPNYRLFFFGQLISRIGTWMQRTAVIWVVYMMTHSVLMVGLTTFAEQFPSFILSPAGGIAADRHNRFKVLMLTQGAALLQAVLLTCVYFSGFHPIWVILLLSAFLGVANAYDVPVRQAMVNDIIPNDDDLPSAIAMNSSLNNFTRLAGPALAGIVLAKYGATVCFAFNAVSFLAVIICLNKMTFPPYIPKENDKNPWTDFMDGIRYTKSNEDIGMTLYLSAFVSLLVITYNTLQPYFAKDVFHGDAATYGYINASTGLGALVSTLYIASQKNAENLKTILLHNLVLLGIGLMLMSYIHFFPIYLVMCFICGFGTMSVMPICNTIIQTSSSPQMRGRVVGFFAMSTLGTLPLGSLLIGWLAKYIGAQNCQLVQGIICVLIALAFYKFLRKPTIHITKDTLSDNQ